jgi:thiamine-phosphate pyrophosphorylase
MKPLRGLYAIVDLPSARPAAALAEALLDGGARILQLRMKQAPAAEMLAAAAPLRALCKSRGATFIVNDRLDVALAAEADGAHLGQDDLPLAAARPLVPPGFILGISTHNEAQARAAVEGGADYIGFGPCFATQTKLNPDPVVGLDQLARVCQLGTPVVAIGGITLETAAAVARAGAAAAAVIRAVNAAADVASAARQVAATFA